MLSSVANVCHAAFVLTGFTDNPGDFTATFNWDFPAMGNDSTGKIVGPNANWTLRDVRSTPQAGAARQLSAFPQHDPGTQPDPDMGRMRPPGSCALTSNAGAGAPATKTFADADRVTHGFMQPNRAPHADYFITTAKAPRNAQLPVEVRVLGKHVGQQKALEAWFENFSNVPLTVMSLIPSYGKDDFGDPIVASPEPVATVGRTSDIDEVTKQSEGSAPLVAVARQGCSFLVQANDGPQMLDEVWCFEAHRVSDREV